MSYDGEAFRALDGEAFKDSFGDDQPLDVWLEQRIRSNTLYLSRGYDSVSVPYLTTASDLGADTSERYWASRNIARHDFWAVEVTRGMTGFTISANHACGAEDSGGTGVNVEWRIVDWTGPRPSEHRIMGSESLAVANSSGAFGADEITVTFTGGVWTGSPRVLFLELWIQSDAAAAEGSSFSCDWVSPHVLHSNSAIVLEENFAQAFLRDDLRDVDYDVFNVNTRSNTFKVYPAVSQHSEELDYDEYWMHWLQIRGLSIRPNYAPTLRADLPSTAELGAQQSVSSVTAMPQIQGAVGTTSQVRHLAFGPHGSRPSAEGTIPAFYLWGQSPCNEVIMPGSAVEGQSTLECVVVWTPVGTTDRDLEATTTVTIRGLFGGDTDWADATVMASGLIDTAHTNQTERSLVAVSTLKRFVGANTSTNDSLTWFRDVQNMAVVRVPITLIDGFSNADWRRPLEIDISAVATINGTPVTVYESVYICAYTLISRGL